MLRHTGAKLGEVLAIADTEDFDLVARKVRLGGRGEDAKPWREVYMPHELHAELGDILRDTDYAEAATRLAIHMTALQAAQQVTVRIQALSLFNQL